MRYLDPRTTQPREQEECVYWRGYKGLDIPMGVLLANKGLKQVYLAGVVHRGMVDTVLKPDQIKKMHEWCETCALLVACAGLKIQVVNLDI